MDLAWISLFALLAVVVVSCTMRVNPGLVAIALAGAIVAFAGLWFQDAPDVKALVAGFPDDLFLTLLGVSLLFTQAEVNGTLARVAGAAQLLCRGNVGLIPVMFFILACGLGTAGPGNIAVAGLLAPVAMASAQRAGIPALLMALMIGHGAIACTLSPFTAAGIVADKNLVAMGLSGHEWQIYAYNALANAAFGFAGYLLLGGWRLFRKADSSRSGPPAEAANGGHSGSKGLALTTRHWITLAVIAALVLSVVVGKVHVGLGAFAGAAVLSLLRLADERETFLKIPWSVIVMICGVSVLTSLLGNTGGTRRFAELIDTISTPRTVTGVLAFVTGITSIYSSTTGVVLPAFLPMVKDLAASQPGTSTLSLALAVLIGGNLVDMSPLSTIGALCVAGTPENVDRRVLFNQLLAWGFALAVLGSLGCWMFLGHS